jgi:hypothetical protein
MLGHSDPGIVDNAPWDAANWHLNRFSLVAQPVTEFPSSQDLQQQQKQQQKQKYGSMHSSNSAGSIGKTANLCQVNGCTVDVASGHGQKAYNSRYRICETHLKSMCTYKDGIAVRFCQQCGKFQAVEEFDGDKRSCRERLERHNARRRRLREMQHMLRTTGQVDEDALKAKYGMAEDDTVEKTGKVADRHANGGAGRKRSVPDSQGAVAGPHRTSSFESGMDSGSTDPSSGEISFGGGGNGDADNLFVPLPGDLSLLDDVFLDDILGPVQASSNALMDSASQLIQVSPVSCFPTCSSISSPDASIWTSFLKKEI